MQLSDKTNKNNSEGRRERKQRGKVTREPREGSSHEVSCKDGRPAGVSGVLEPVSEDDKIHGRRCGGKKKH